MAATEPCVSIVIPCFNAERYIAKAVASAVAQGPDVEVIVVNDGSSDGSLAALASFRDRITICDGPRQGAPAARNVGLAAAGGTVVFFLDADDFYEDIFVVELARASTADGADAGIGNYRMLFPDETEHVYDVLPVHASRTSILRAWAHTQGPQTGVVAWRRSFLEKIGGWRPDLLQLQDNELGLRAGLLGADIRRYEFGDLIYQFHASPERVSTKRSAEVFVSLARALSDLEALSRARSDAEQRIVGEFAYAIACRAFRAGFLSEGRHALSMARRNGFQGHVGRGTHRLAATVLGLELKERVALQTRRLRAEALTPRRSASGGGAP